MQKRFIGLQSRLMASVTMPMAEPTQIENRVRNILYAESKRKTVTRQAGLTFGLVALGLLLPLASLRPVSGSQDPLPTPPPMTVQKPFTVVVDAGHGGQDNGVIGPDGTREKDINLAIAKKLEAALTKSGVHVVMTHTGDTFLPVMARPALVAPNHADYLVSIHCDSGVPPGAHSGPVGYYHGNNLTEQWLASVLLGHVSKVISTFHFNVLSDLTRFSPGGFGVLRGSPVPSVLIECGSLNNTHDLTALRQEGTQQKIADGIASGLKEYNVGFSAAAVQKKLAYVAAVHAHNKQIIQFWNEVAQNTGVYFMAIRKRKPELWTAVLATPYVLNGQPLTKQQARKQLQDQMTQYGTRHFTQKFVKFTDISPTQMTLFSTDHWEPIRPGAKAATFSRRDVWTKSTVGWRLSSSDVTPVKP